MVVQDGYPIVLPLRGAKVAVVGGGTAAARKIGPLAGAGARVVVISPRLGPEVAALAEEGRIQVIGRTYGGADDLRGAVLAFAATDRPEVNDAVLRDAALLGIPACDAGDPGKGAFHVPAVMRRGRLLMAVSTSGASPAFARKIRDELEAAYGPEYADALDFLAEARRLVQERVPDMAERAAVLRSLAERDWPALARGGRLAGMSGRLLAHLANAERIGAETIDELERMAAGPAGPKERDKPGVRPPSGETGHGS